MDKDDIIIYSLGSLAIIMFVILIVAVVQEVMFANKVDDYCKEIGFDGLEEEDRLKRCYKYQPHPSGIGMGRIYSGEITRDMLEGIE